MSKTKLSKDLAAWKLNAAPILSTKQADADDETGANLAVEQASYERAILDFETKVRRERDEMRFEHLARVRLILGDGA